MEQPTPQKRSGSRRWIIVIIVFVLFVIITSQFPLLEMLAELGASAWSLAIKLLAAALQGLRSLFQVDSFHSLIHANLRESFYKFA